MSVASLNYAHKSFYLAKSGLIVRMLVESVHNSRFNGNFGTVFFHITTEARRDVWLAGVHGRPGWPRISDEFESI